jgi:UDP-N-acetylglucosamine--dolichyl-phosphate N-acetylglucosaminephosphotransferase
MEPILFLPFIVSFFITFLVLPKWIKRARNAGLEGKNMNTHRHEKIAEAGGIVVITGFIVSVLVYIALKTFYFKTSENLVSIFALISSIMIISFIGMIDDILGWKIGLGKRVRLFLCLIAAVPLMVINAGNSGIILPFAGRIDMGLLYPLLIIPIGIIGASTTFNFLAGYNGLEAGQGILILGALSFVSYTTGNTWLSLIGICMVFSLVAFWIFNKYPAKVLPGNVITYAIGGLIAIMAILGNMERIAILFFIPYIFEVILKSRGKLKKESFGKPNKDNSLEMPYDKIYGLEHLAIWLLKKIKKDGKAYEREVVYVINLFQIMVILLGLAVFVIFR